VHTPGPMALVWITVARGVIAIVLGLALALHHDRAHAALVNFMGVYWILSGIVTFQWGLAAEGPRRRLPLVARWLRAGRQVGPALASRSAIGDPRDWARDDTDPDGGSP